MVGSSWLIILNSMADGKWLVNQGWCLVDRLFIIFKASLVLSSSTRGRFYLSERRSGQAVVTDVFPSLPPLPLVLTCLRFYRGGFIQSFSILTAHRFYFLEFCQLTLSRTYWFVIHTSDDGWSLAYEPRLVVIDGLLGHAGSLRLIVVDGYSTRQRVWLNVCTKNSEKKKAFSDTGVGHTLAHIHGTR